MGCRCRRRAASPTATAWRPGAATPVPTAAVERAAAARGVPPPDSREHRRRTDDRGGDEGQTRSSVEVQSDASASRPLPGKPGHRAQHAERLGEGRGAEEHPADHHDEQRVGVAERPRPAREPVRRGPPARAPGTPPWNRPQTTNVQLAPCHSPHRKNTITRLHVHAPRRHAVAAERDVEVVAEPGRQRDVPAPPELGEALRDVRVVEVLEEAEPEHPAEPDRHVRVAGEVEVDLERVAERAEPGERRR